MSSESPVSFAQLQKELEQSADVVRTTLVEDEQGFVNRTLPLAESVALYAKLCHLAGQVSVLKEFETMFSKFMSPKS